MDRRQFLRAVAGAGAGALAGPALSRLGASPARSIVSGATHAGARSAAFLIPMDDEQPQPLRAYGIVYRALESGGRAEWLLNFRGGAFLVDHPPALDEALDRGVWTEDPSASAGALQAALGTEDTVPMKLEVAPKIAVYVPPYAAPWDDAVRLALDFAEIPYRSLWDSEVLRDGLAEVDWLHLHHEDFTGQYGKYGLGVQTAAWYQQAVGLDRATAGEFGFADGRELKAAVADKIRDYVASGGFLFAMCASSETLDVALSGEGSDFAGTLAFRDFAIDPSISGPFSTIDGHRVNTPERLPLDDVVVERFSATVDPVAAMLTQDHDLHFPDWYGLTTSYRPDTLKPSVVVLATCGGGRLAKYVHGDHGEGSFTFLGGHDPEDPRHAVGDPATDLREYPASPGYRLILNNVLFPAAEKKERLT
ncbi:MAG TPA: asparagine synthetase B [Gemmatimonadota bacterium]|nr:asparagine synthetase B [Gemmatimonadota bacterium]